MSRARSNSASASFMLPDRASISPRIVKACASATPLAGGAALGGSPLSGVEDNGPRSNEQPESVIASAASAAGRHGSQANGSGRASDADTRAAYGAIGSLPGCKMHGSKTTIQKTTTEKITTEKNSIAKTTTQKRPRKNGDAKTTTQKRRRKNDNAGTKARVIGFRSANFLSARAARAPAWATPTAGTTPLRAGSGAEHRLRLHREQAFALQLLARELARATHGFGLFTRLLFGRFFIVTAELHLAENALALHFLLQRLEGLVDIVIANENLHAASSFNWSGWKSEKAKDRLSQVPNPERADVSDKGADVYRTGRDRGPKSARAQD